MQGFHKKKEMAICTYSNAETMSCFIKEVINKRLDNDLFLNFVI